MAKVKTKTRRGQQGCTSTKQPFFGVDGSKSSAPSARRMGWWISSTTRRRGTATPVAPRTHPSSAWTVARSRSSARSTGGRHGECRQQAVRPDTLHHYRVKWRGCNKRDLCSQHKMDGMVDLASKRCGQQGCTTQPSFGTVDGASKREFCLQHKLGRKEGMIRVVKKPRRAGTANGG